MISLALFDNDKCDLLQAICFDLGRSLFTFDTFRWVVAGKILLQRPESFSHSSVVGEELYVSCMFWSALRQKEGNRAWKHWKVEWDVYRAISEARCGWKDRLNHWKEALNWLRSLSTLKSQKPKHFHYSSFYFWYILLPSQKK